MTDDTDKIDNEVCTDTYKPSDDFSAEIKKLRLKKNLTQEMFATALKVDVTSVRNWEHGKNFPHDCTCKKIISAFSLTEEEQVLLFVIDNKSKICNESGLSDETAASETAENATPSAVPADPAAVPSANSVIPNVSEEYPSSVIPTANSVIPSVSEESPPYPSPSPTGEGGAAPAATDEGHRHSKPPITSKIWWGNFKLKWKNYNAPFKILIISLGVWLLEWGVIAIVCAMYYINHISIKGVISIDIDFRELIIPLILSFITTILLTATIYSIIKKIITKRKEKK